MEPTGNYSRHYYQKNRDRIRARSAAYYEKNRDKVLARLAKKHKENPDVMRQRVKDYYRSNSQYKQDSLLRSQMWVKENPEKRKRHVRRSRIRKYGITPEQYDEMLETQGNCCAICGKGNKRVMAIDHCHKTGKVRALLCDSCNTSLGHVEKEGFLEKALQYIAKYK